MENQTENINEHVEKPFIVKDKSRWYIQFWYRDSENKRKSYKRAFTLNSTEFLKKVKGADVEINKTGRKAMAEAFIDGLIEKLSTNYFNPENQTFEPRDKSSLPLTKYFDEYINENSKYEKSEGTKITYTAYNNTLITYLNNEDNNYNINIKLNEATHHFVQDFLSYIENKDSLAHRDNLLMYVKAVFSWCKDTLEIIAVNPGSKFKAINKYESESNRAMKIEEIKSLLIKAKELDFHFYIILKLVFYTLRRPNELLKLRYENFDFENNHIKFTDKIIKTKKTQYSTIPADVMAEIKNSIPAKVKDNDYFLGNIGKVKDLTKKGKTEYSKMTFGKEKTPYHHFGTKFLTVKNRLKLADGYTLYGMKHSGINYLIEEHNWTNLEIRSYTGHTSDKMLERYARNARRQVKPHPATI